MGGGRCEFLHVFASGSTSPHLAQKYSYDMGSYMKEYILHPFLPTSAGSCFTCGIIVQFDSFHSILFAKKGQM